MYEEGWPEVLIRIPYYQQTKEPIHLLVEYHPHLICPPVLPLDLSYTVLIRLTLSSANLSIETSNIPCFKPEISFPLPR